MKWTVIDEDLSLRPVHMDGRQYIEWACISHSKTKTRWLRFASKHAVGRDNVSRYYEDARRVIREFVKAEKKRSKP